MWTKQMNHMTAMFEINKIVRLPWFSKTTRICYSCKNLAVLSISNTLVTQIICKGYTC